MSVEIKRVKDLQELTEVTPLIIEGFKEMNKRYKAFEVSVENFVKEIIRIVGSQPRNGLVVVWVDGVPVGYGAARDNTELFSEQRQLLLFALYIKREFSREYAKPLFQHAEQLAREQGYDTMVAYNGRFSGAGYRFFEKILGMRRESVRFKKQIR